MIFEGIGLAIIVLGIQMSLQVENLIVFIFSILIGGIIGEAVDLEKYFEVFANWLKSKVGSDNKNLLKDF